MERLFICTLLVATATCAAAGEKDMTLRDEGYIKVSGGCIAYMTGEIKFAPEVDGGVRVVVDNTGGWFHVGSGRFLGCDVSLPAEDASAFFAGLADILDHPQKPEHGPSTAMTEVEIYLPLAGGDVNTTWREADAEYDVGPLLVYLRESVVDFTLNHTPN
jgi:hypothetical protein